MTERIHFESGSTDPHVEKIDKRERFDKITKKIRDEISQLTSLDENIRSAIFRVLDLTYDDFKSEVLDRSKIYAGLPESNKIFACLAERLEEELIPYADDGSSKVQRIIRGLKSLAEQHDS